MSGSQRGASPPTVSPTAVKQDKWMTALTGQEVDRGKRLIGAQRPPPKPAWQGATPTTGAPRSDAIKGSAQAALEKARALDEARRAKLVEIDAALKEATDAAALLVPPIPRGPVDAAILDVTARRKTLADAAPDAVESELGKAAALLADIGNAKAAAVKAKDDWARTLKARDDKLIEVDTALKEVTDATALLTAPLVREPMDRTVAGLAARRKTLADAADPMAIAAAMKDAPTLLSDLAKAKAAAGRAKVDWEQAEARSTAVGNTLKNATAELTWLPKGTEGAMTSELDGLKTRLADLAKATTLSAYVGALPALEKDSGDFLKKAETASAAPYADKQLDTLGIVARRCGELAKPNPMQNTLDAIKERRKNAGALTGQALVDELVAIGNAANSAVSTGWGAYQKRETIAKQVYALRSPLAALPPGTGQTGMEGEKTALEAALKEAFRRSDQNIGAVGVALGTLQSDADALKGKIEAARIAALDEDKAKLRITKALTETKKAIDALTDPTTKLGFNNDYTPLKQRADNAPGITNTKNRKTELVAVEKSATAMLERAHKASFEAQLKQPDGKQKIAELIATFGERTDDPVQQAICKAAMSACYKLDLDVPEGMSCTRLPKLFELFGMVPAKDLKNLTNLEYETDPDMSSSYHTSGKIVLNKVGDENDMYALRKDQPGSRVNYFNATTLHEIGHNADDANGVMGGKEGDAGFGGWKKETVESVAAAHYETAFKVFVGTGKKPAKADLLAMIETVLETGACAKPANATAKLGTLFADWDAITGSTGFAKLNLVRGPDSNPWEKHVDCSDSRSYHEGYNGDWYSYAASARASKISDYMWRAPGEWFADQYAYYRMHKDKEPPAPIRGYVRE